MGVIVNPGALNNFQGGPIRFVDITQNVQPSHNVIAPAGIIEGDLLFYIDASNEAGVPEHVPTGFTIRESLSLGNHRLILSDKLADGTESGTTLLGLTATSKTTATLLHFSCTNANNDYPPAVTIGFSGATGEMQDGIPTNKFFFQSLVNLQWATFDSFLEILIWHSSPSLAWTDITGSSTGALDVTPFQPSGLQGINGASYDLSNADSNIGLRMTWTTKDAGGSIGIGGFSGFIVDPGSSNAIITAGYQPAPAGA